MEIIKGTRYRGVLNLSTPKGCCAKPSDKEMTLNSAAHSTRKASAHIKGSCYP